MGFGGGGLVAVGGCDGSMMALMSIASGVLRVSWAATKTDLIELVRHNSVLYQHQNTVKNSNNRSCRGSPRNPCTISEVAKSFGLVAQVNRAQSRSRRMVMSTAAACLSFEILCDETV